MLRFVLLLVALPAAAQPSLAPAAAKIWSEPLQLPEESRFIRLAPGSDDPRAEYVIYRKYTDTGFTEEWVTAHATSLMTFRRDGGLVSEHHQNHFRNTGIDVKVSPDRTSVRTVITEQGQVKSDKTMALTPNIALREELNHLVLQAWRNGIRDGLLCQSLSPDGGLVGDFQIAFRPTADPTTLSDKYDYPAEFRQALSHGPYVVADMSLRGIASLFFPHHFYLVYAAKPEGLEFAGYFGEDPKAPVFQFTPE